METPWTWKVKSENLFKTSEKEKDLKKEYLP
jgi:hypothetical protein